MTQYPTIGYATHSGRGENRDRGYHQKVGRMAWRVGFAKKRSSVTDGEGKASYIAQRGVQPHLSRRAFTDRARRGPRPLPLSLSDEQHEHMSRGTKGLGKGGTKPRRNVIRDDPGITKPAIRRLARTTTPKMPSRSSL